MVLLDVHQKLKLVVVVMDFIIVKMFATMADAFEEFALHQL